MYVRVCGFTKYFTVLLKRVPSCHFLGKFNFIFTNLKPMHKIPIMIKFYFVKFAEISKYFFLKARFVAFSDEEIQKILFSVYYQLLNYIDNFKILTKAKYENLKV